MVRKVEQTREKLMDLSEEDEDLGCFHLSLSVKHFCVTCNEKSNSTAGICKISKKGPENISVDVALSIIMLIISDCYQRVFKLSKTSR